MTTETERKTVAKPALAGGGRITAIIPQDFESCFRLATVIHTAKMAPKSLDSPEKVAVAIMHGLEVGLTPMASVQSIAVIGGMPTIWGDGMLGLIKSTGLLADVEEFIERDKDGVLLAVCKVKRKGSSKWVVGEFSRAQAFKSGLTKKEGPWQAFPDRMYMWRARSYAYRDAFPDVLRGLHVREEVEDMLDVGSASAAPAEPEPRRENWRRSFSDAPPAQDVAPEPTPEPADPEPEPAGDRPSYRIEGVVGEAAIIRAIERSIDDAETANIVERIIADNGEFLQKISSVKLSTLMVLANRRVRTLEAEAPAAAGSEAQA